MNDIALTTGPSGAAALTDRTACEAFPEVTSAAASPTDSPPRRVATGRLEAHDVTVGYRDTVVLDGLTVSVPPGRITTIVGPNGCGKSTLLKTLVRLLRPSSGTVTLDDVPLADIRSRTLATRVGLLPQSPVAPEGVIVSDLVTLGRHPHRSWIRPWARDDGDVVARALKATGVADLADRVLDDLSGGQRQRVWLAMVLAQDTELLLLDEPTTYLDLAYSVELLDLVDALCTDHGRTVVMVLHDLVLATRYSDNLVVLRDGMVVAEGHPADVIDADLLWEVFGLRAEIINDPVSDRPLIVPVGARRPR